jgi:UDP-N-acetylmuramoyl-L-alanyl-D-glutamate--2,6-diaminopimelate ligase
VAVVCVPDGRLALAQLAAAWHGYPSRRLNVIGVTGTDGKTTTCTLIHSVLEAAGHRSGIISTVGARIGGEELDTGFHTTTPDALQVQSYLARMVAANMEYAVLETTSHGLDQQRVAAVDYDVAVLTNVTHEHLDLHGTFASYVQAKARLFHLLTTSARKPGVAKVSILNADDPSYDDFRSIPADICLTYGACGQTAHQRSPSASHITPDVGAEDIVLSASGTCFTAVLTHPSLPVLRLPVTSSLLGRFNVYNAMAAVAVGVSQGVPSAAIVQGIAAVKQVTGRMELISLPPSGPGATAGPVRPAVGSLPEVLVDFAHTPNALEKALELARDLTRGRVIAVFGCAGLRDRGKRALMGAVSGRLADITVITAEDPRTEKVGDIMAQIAVGCAQAGRREGEGYVRVADRGEAIAWAVSAAVPGDLVVICGKGHERSMCFGDTEYPWSDQDAARAALERRQEASGRRV